MSELICKPVNKYCESFVKAKSQTHFCVTSLHSIFKLKSTVRHTLAVPSADDVAKSLK